MQNYRIGSGLSNLGNTCFFNAIIQVILHTESIGRCFCVNKHSSICTTKKWCIFCQLEKLWDQSKKSRVCAPSSIVHNLKVVFKKFRLGRQQDSHQFLRYLVEAMQQAEVGKLTKDLQLNEQKLKNSMVFDSYGGMMQNCVLCHQCGYRSLTSQRYYDLNIECQKSNSLSEGLTNFFKADQLTGHNKYYCEKCQKQNNARKCCYLMKNVPEVMTFQLKRFTNTMRKIGKNISYPRFINVGKYFEQPVESFRYELYAVTVHAGYSSTSGHYYSFVKWNGQWYEMNDSHVSKCGEERAFNQQAYILFYKRVSPKEVLQNNPRSLEEVKQSLEAEKNNLQKIEELCKKDQKQSSTQQKNSLSYSIKETQNHEVEKQSKENSEIRKEDQKKQPEEGVKLRKKSKQQARQNMTIGQMLLNYQCDIDHLSSKIPSRGKRLRSFQSVYNLRKYEIVMKRRKMC